jgi:hypothetical protein
VPTRLQRAYCAWILFSFVFRLRGASFASGTVIPLRFSRERRMVCMRDSASACDLVPIFAPASISRIAAMQSWALSPWP